MKALSPVLGTPFCSRCGAEFFCAGRSPARRAGARSCHRYRQPRRQRMFVPCVPRMRRLTIGRRELRLGPSIALSLNERFRPEARISRVDSASHCSP